MNTKISNFFLDEKLSELESDIISATEAAEELEISLRDFNLNHSKKLTQMTTRQRTGKRKYSKLEVQAYKIKLYNDKLSESEYLVASNTQM